MTDLQKEIVAKLLLGYNIAATGANGYRLRSPEQQVCKKVSVKTFQKLRKLLRKTGGVFVINKNKVRQLHGKSWIKKEYKLIQTKIPG